MIVPVLKGFDSLDHDPIDQWVPSPGPLHYSLNLQIGESGDEAADLYRVDVLNPLGLHESSWKQRRDRRTPPIVVNPYSWAAVLNAVGQRLGDSAGHDWLAVQDKLRQVFSWEYEDYR